MADIFRVPKIENFSIISNIHFKDRRLSLRAKGLLSLILSLPSDWDLTLKGLVKICTEGRDAVGNTVKELQSFGYVKKSQTRHTNGKLGKIRNIRGYLLAMLFNAPASMESYYQALFEQAKPE